MTNEKVSRAASVQKKAFIRARVISTAIAWYKAGCPEANEDGDGPMGELQDACHEYIDHEGQVDARAEERKQRYANQYAAQKDPAVLAARVIEWLSSPEGQESMRQAAAQSEELAEKLRAARNIPWEKLHAPFTI
jgi:hypothetical protein